MEIQPNKQNLNETFSNKVYFIDFYQRDYKWTEEPVKRLLDDVFYQFDEAYAKHSDLDPNKENINARYPWYYLNTYGPQTHNELCRWAGIDPSALILKNDTRRY